MTTHAEELSATSIQPFGSREVPELTFAILIGADRGPAPVPRQESQVFAIQRKKRRAQTRHLVITHS